MLPAEIAVTALSPLTLTGSKLHDRTSANRLCAGCAREAVQRTVAGRTWGPRWWRWRSIESTSVDEHDARRWLGEYLNVFEACGRGEREAGSLLAYYGVPLLVATDDGFTALSSEEQVVAAAQQQIDGMRGAAYDHSDVLGSEVIVLNHTSALYRGEFSRHRADGDEISRLTVTYLLTDGSVGRRISALVLHSP
jgi:hypothetical protein